MASGKRFLTILLLLCCYLVGSSLAFAQELTVAAAADLQFALRDLASTFEKQTGTSVKISFGSSGNFANQIANGAPFDMFFSADLGYPRHLEEAGLTEPGTLYHYADGKIVLWAREPRFDVTRGLFLLVDPGIRKIAVANPQHAPYGRAAVAALQHEHLYDKVQNKLVFGENISQTAQFVDTGNADVGIVALSLLLAPTMQGKGKYFLIPDSDYPPIEQGCVVLKSAKNKALAQQFLAFVKQPQTVALLRKYGFGLPGQPRGH